MQDDFMPFFNASSVTVYEQRGRVNACTFSIATLIETGFFFATHADKWFVPLSMMYLRG